MDQTISKLQQTVLWNSVPVSVVIPCYRCADTIGAAVDSVLNQTSRPMEIILVEDFSKDHGRTLKMLEAIQNDLKELMKVIVVALPNNRGAGEARNAGWNAACHEYIAFLDSDDVWHPQKLEIQTTLIMRRPNFLLSCHGYRLYQQALNGTFDTKFASSVEVTWRQLLFINKIAMSTVMIRRNTHHRFPNDVRYAEDFQLWMRLLVEGNKVFNINFPLAYFFKEPFMPGGLSGNLMAMHKAVLLCMYDLHEERSIPFGIYFFALAFEKIKFLRRILISKFNILIREYHKKIAD
jgi:glycosyltransferase involved in cell wall biosynthesis